MRSEAIEAPNNLPIVEGWQSEQDRDSKITLTLHYPSGDLYRQKLPLQVRMAQRRLNQFIIVNLWVLFRNSDCQREAAATEVWQSWISQKCLSFMVGLPLKMRQRFTASVLSFETSLQWYACILEEWWTNMQWGGGTDKAIFDWFMSDYLCEACLLTIISSLLESL